MSAPVQPVRSTEEVAERLATEHGALAALGIRALSLFGSLARGEARPDSDVDLLVEFSVTPGLVGYVRARDYLARLLGRPVDLVMRSGLRPSLRLRVEGEARRVA